MHPSTQEAVPCQNIPVNTMCYVAEGDVGVDNQALFETYLASLSDQVGQMTQQDQQQQQELPNAVAEEEETTPKLRRKYARKQGECRAAAAHRVVFASCHQSGR